MGSGHLPDRKSPFSSEFMHVHLSLNCGIYNLATSKIALVVNLNEAEDTENLATSTNEKRP